MTPLLHWVVTFCDVTTVLLCVVCKIPQIMLIYRSKSVEGLSENSLALELLTYVISLSYNAMKSYPVSSYMEDPFLSVQTLIVLLIVYSYNDKLSRKTIGVMAGLCGVFYLLSYGIPHPMILQGLLVKHHHRVTTPLGYGICVGVTCMCVTATLPMKVFSKLLQLSQIWKAKSAGSISMVSWGINIYTCVTRIVTTLLVTNDTTILIKHIFSVTLNSAVVASAWWFNGTKKKAD